MGCFLACFSSCKHRKPKHLVNVASSVDRKDRANEALEVIESIKQEVIEESIKHVKKSKKLEELLSCNEKGVTFDFNVKNYEALSTENNEERESETNKEQSYESKSAANLVASDVPSSPSKPICQNCATKENKNVDLEDGDNGNGGDQKSVQEESSESLFSLSIDSRKQGCKAELAEKEVSSSMPKCGLPNDELVAVGSDGNAQDGGRNFDSTLIEVGNLTSWDIGKEDPSDETNSILRSNGSSCPPNYRYQDCEKEDPDGVGFEDFDLDNSGNFDNEGSDDQVFVQPESSESLFSVSIDSRKQESSESLFSVSIGSRKQESGGELVEKEVTSPMPKSSSPDAEVKPVGSIQNAHERSQLVDSALNPVENLIQWKTVKEKMILPLQHQDKENMHINPEPCLKLLTKNSKTNANQRKPMEQEIAVDTSLSAWLVNSETTPMSESSVDSDRNSLSGRASSTRSEVDRPILRAVSIKELKQLSVLHSSRNSRSRSHDETPTIGTIGSYWSHTGQNGHRFRHS